MLIWSQEAFVSGLGLSLLHSLWQGALLGGLGFALHKRLKNATPDLRCGVFSLLQLTFCVIWLGTFLSLYRVAIHAVTTAGSASAELIAGGVSALPTATTPTPGLLHQFHSLAPLLVTVWALGVCVLSLRHLGGLLFLYRLCRVETVPCLPAWEDCTERLAARMGIGRKILLRCTPRIDVPCAFGLFKSYILLPASAMMGLTPEQAEALIAHELAHIARHDVFFNSVQVCMETILFYHPVVWWLSMQVRVAREQRCDDLAVQIIGDRALYARALYSLEEARASLPQLALGAKGDSSRMTNWHLIHRIQRVLGVSSPEKRDPWAKGALALCAATLGLAALMPVRAYSRPTHQDPPAKKEPQVKVATKILMNINGEKIEFDTTELTPDTPVTINDKLLRFGDLPEAKQVQLKEALKAVRIEVGPPNVKFFLHQGDAPTGAKGSKVIFSKNAVTNIQLDINGDKIELHTTDLKPDTTLKVNGKEGRFGDLTPQQQQQLQKAVKNVPAPDISSLLKDAFVLEGGHDGSKFTRIMVSKGSEPKIVTHLGGTNVKSYTLGGKSKIVLIINGDEVELTSDSTNFTSIALTPNTPVKVNGKEGRFGDLTPKQQEQLKAAVKGVSIHVVSNATLLGQHAGTPAAEATIKNGHPKILVNVNGDTIEITGNTADLSAENLPADTLVKVNGKESRFGDLTETQQQAIRDTKASVHVNAASDAKQTVPPAPAPDKP